MWPFSEMSLVAAGRLGDLANICLLVSLVVGVISTFVIVKTSDVKEHHWEVAREQSNERIAELTTQGERLVKDAADANQRTESERLARVNIEKAIIEELAQRDIKREQMDAVSSAIKGHVGTIYLYSLADPEASRYAFAISETLKAGGADVKLILSGTKNVPSFPDKFNVAVSITGVTVYESNGKHELVDLLVRAFREAGIIIQGMWSEGTLAGVIDGKWVADAGVKTPAIFVGLKPPPFSRFPAYATPPTLEEFFKNHPPAWEPKQGIG